VTNLFITNQISVKHFHFKAKKSKQYPTFVQLFPFSALRKKHLTREQLLLHSVTLPLPLPLPTFQLKLLWGNCMLNVNISIDNWERQSTPEAKKREVVLVRCRSKDPFLDSIHQNFYWWMWWMTKWLEKRKFFNEAAKFLTYEWSTLEDLCYLIRTARGWRIACMYVAL